MAEMTSVRLWERDDHWVLPLSGETVVQCCYDYGFTLMVGESGPSFVVRIEQAFTLSAADGSTSEHDPEGDPRGMSDTLSVLRATITRSIAHKDGRLEIDFEDGSLIRVPGSDEYEPWQFTGPDGLRMVPAAGGELVVWSGD